jgi:predicted ester cyclase
MATVEENRQASLKFVDAMNEHDFGYIRDLLADDFVDQTPRPGSSGNKEDTVAFLEAMSKGITDMHGEALETIADGDTVAIRTRRSGTDTGGFMPGMSPTGTSFTIEAIDISVFNDEGKIVSHSGIVDTMSAMGQLGLLPPPPG